MRIKLVFGTERTDIPFMAKVSKTARNARSGRYVAAGKTPDGVTILMQKTKPTHFTTREIRTTITELRRDAATGRSRESMKTGSNRSESKR
ncbi:MAG TPA: hypothetical protein VGA77_11270 [Propylenella sp.]